ncbi:MAG: hypothetical protein ACLQVD_07570 [Capsulimonadaceae bacterium]
MNVTIPFTQTEEAVLMAAVRQSGVDLPELIKRLTLEHLQVTEADDIDARLRLWQMRDGTPLNPDVPAHTLFAMWAEEDAAMTDEERDAEDRLWEDIENGLAGNRGLRLRQVAS